MTPGIKRIGDRFIVRVQRVGADGLRREVERVVRGRLEVAMRTRDEIACGLEKPRAFATSPARACVRCGRATARGAKHCSRACAGYARHKEPIVLCGIMLTRNEAAQIAGVSRKGLEARLRKGELATALRPSRGWHRKTRKDTK